MSKVDQTLWRNPFTLQGLRLPTAVGGESFRLHETGVMILDKDWLHREVCSPFWRLFYEFSEGAWVECAGRRHLLDRDCAILLPEGVPFNCGSKEGVSHLWIHFSLPASGYRDHREAIRVVVGPDFQVLSKTLYEATEAKQVERSRHLGSALLHIAFASTGSSMGEFPGVRMQRVLSWLEHHMQLPITNALLAAQVGMGVESFIRWFKERTGRTPAVYVAEYRVREASRRLAYEEESIEQIAEAVGFSNRHHFSRVFKRYVGMGPAEFRRSYANR